MKNKYLYILIMWLPLLSSCYDDKGNYSYSDINEILIDTFGQEYNAYYLIDTLKINPDINFTLDSQDNERYEYEWSIISDMFSGGENIVIGNDRNLNYYVKAPKNTYTLVLKVKDKETGIVWNQKSRLIVSTYFDHGWMLLGEDKNGYVLADMVCIPNDVDTIIVKDVLSTSGLKDLKGARNMVAINYYRNNPIFLLSEESTYELNIEDFSSGEYNNLKNKLYDTNAGDNFTASDIIQNSGSTRFMIGNERAYKTGTLFMSDYYGNPISRYSNPNSVFKVAPYFAYDNRMYGYISGNLILYNKDEGKFVKIGLYSSYCSDLPDDPDNPNEVFKWNCGHKLLNLFNSNYVDPAIGRLTYALMENDQNQKFIYSFCVGYTPRKGGCYDLSALQDIGELKFCGFSGEYPIMLYIAGSRLYGYNLVSSENVLLKDFGNLEVTMLHFDTFYEKDETFYIATYDNNDEENKGGVVTKYKIIRDPNNILIDEITTSRWENLCKAKSMTWKWR